MLTDSHGHGDVTISKTKLLLLSAAAILLLVVGGTAFAYTRHVAQVHAERVAAAQRTLDKYLAAEKQLQDADKTYRSTVTAASTAWHSALTAGQQRHDLGVGPNWDLQTEYADLKNEAAGVDTLQTDMETLRTTRQRQIAILASLYGDSALSKVREDEQRREILTDHWLSPWQRAVADMKDSDEAQINGEDGVSTNSSDIDHYYAQSTDAENELEAMTSTTNAYWDALKQRVKNDISRARADLRAAQHG